MGKRSLKNPSKVSKKLSPDISSLISHRHFHLFTRLSYPIKRNFQNFFPVTPSQQTPLSLQPPAISSCPSST